MTNWKGPYLLAGEEFYLYSGRCEKAHSSMDEQVQLVISLYEEEKARLQSLISTCLEEEEYQMAHYHLNALYKTNSQIRILRNLDDRYYDDKEIVLRRMEGSKKWLAREGNGSFREYYEQQLQRSMKELEELNQLSMQETRAAEEGLLEESLHKLVEGKISHFRLVFKQSVNLYIAFTYAGKTLRLTFPHLKAHKKNDLLTDWQINSMRTLGFSLNERETKLVLIIEGKKEDILSNLKRVLLKIVFEIFQFREFNRQCFLQYKEKADRI